jgi:type II secretory pathway pseudopilin PulG
MTNRRKQKDRKQRSNAKRAVDRALEAYKGGHREIATALEVMRIAQTTQLARSPEIRSLSYRYTLA